MSLDVIPKRRNTDPPSERFLTPRKADDGTIAMTEIRYLRDTIRFIENVGNDHLSELLRQLSDTLDDTKEDDSNDVVFNRLRRIRQILESDDLSEKV